MLRCHMPDTHAKLEALFDKVRALPEPQQELIADALADMTRDQVYQLSDDELAVLVPELEGARRGEFASAAEVDAVLNTPWVRPRTP